jgi:hypothetical protein
MLVCVLARFGLNARGSLYKKFLKIPLGIFTQSERSWRRWLLRKKRSRIKNLSQITGYVRALTTNLN